MLAAPVDAAGRVVRLADFEFEPGIPTAEILAEVRAEAYRVAVERIEMPDADDEARWAAWDAEADRVEREVCRYYFGNTE